MLYEGNLSFIWLDPLKHSHVLFGSQISNQTPMFCQSVRNCSGHEWVKCTHTINTVPTMSCLDSCGLPEGPLNLTILSRISKSVGRCLCRLIMLIVTIIGTGVWAIQDPKLKSILEGHVFKFPSAQANVTSGDICRHWEDQGEFCSLCSFYSLSRNLWHV